MAPAVRQRLASTTAGGSRPRRLPAEELAILGTAYPNLLLTGPSAATAAALVTLRARFRPPIVTWRTGAPLVLQPTASARTLVLDDVASLSLIDQQRLLDWLRRGDGTTQVVAISSLKLLPLVKRGTFLAALYYLLNVICLEVGS